MKCPAPGCATNRPRRSRCAGGGEDEGVLGTTSPGEFLDGRLNASAAVFQVNQGNLAQEDTRYLIPGAINQAYHA